VFQARIAGLLPTRADWRASAAPVGRGSVIGFVVGILAGIGAVIPSFISYALERRLSRHPERFGRGAIEGVAGPESANNAATGGAIIPLLTLGIAPNVPMAVLLGAFLIHGVQPGPLMLTERPELFWGVVASMYVGNVLLLALNLPLIGIWVQLLRVPYGLLFPLILLFCVIGVWSEAGNPADLVVLVVFGVVGYLMKKLAFDPAPLVLAFVLGRMAEEALRQSLLLSRGSPAILATRPLTTAILVVAAVIAILPAVMPRLRRRLPLPAE
jgi:putative tricarboxylic transport membrane protein